jgi:hypothetical protein
LRTHYTPLISVSCKNFLAARLLHGKVAQANMPNEEMHMKLAILSAVATVALAVSTSTASAQLPLDPIAPGPIPVSPGVVPVTPAPVIVAQPPVIVSPPPVVVARPPVVVVAPPVVPAVTVVRPGLTIGIGVPGPVVGFYGRPYYYGHYHSYHR